MYFFYLRLSICSLLNSHQGAIINLSSGPIYGKIMFTLKLNITIWNKESKELQKTSKIQSTGGISVTTATT